MPKRLGNAEFTSGRFFFRLSRSVDPTRKRHLVEDPNVTTLEQAQEIAHKATLEALTERLRLSPKPDPSKQTDTVEEWFRKWCDEREARHYVENKRHDLGRLETHVFPVIGSWRMATIPRDNIEELVERLDEKIRSGALSWKTAATTWGVVTKGFRDACGGKMKALRIREPHDNPTLGVQPPERGDEKEKAFLYPSEFWKLITSPALITGEGLPPHIAANVANASRRWLRSFVLAAYLGTRAGELAILDWQDIDLEHWSVTIRRAAKRDTGRKKEKRTKTGITRTFEIETTLRPLLLAMWAEQGKPKRGRIINLPHECDLSERFQRYLEWAGVDRASLFIDDATRCPITFKDLRATYATWRAIRGDDGLKIQRACGHKSFNTTTIYIRAAEDLGKRAGAPFPPLTPFLLGSSATPRAHLQSVGKGSRPASVPQLSRKTRKSSKLQKKVASPAGFESAKVAKSPGENGSCGTNVPRNDPKRPPTIAAGGTAARAIARALDDAIRSGNAADAAELATALALASTDRSA